MKTFDIKIDDPEGLHARPASRLVSLCHCYNSEIVVYYGGVKANGKNITEVLALGAEKGDIIKIDVGGNDESEAEDALKDLFKNNRSETWEMR